VQSQTDWNISDNCRSAKSIRDHPLTLLIAADEVICRNYSQPVMARGGPSVYGVMSAAGGSRHKLENGGFGF